jgi:hypothetical protein
VILQLMCDLITISKTIQSRNSQSSGRGLYSIGALVGESPRTVARENQIEETVPGLMVSKCDATKQRGRTAGGAIAPPAILIFRASRQNTNFKPNWYRRASPVPWTTFPLATLGVAVDVPKLDGAIRLPVALGVANWGVLVTLYMSN